MADWRDQFLHRCAEIDGAALGEGAFSPGPAIWVSRREVAHFDADGSLDVRLTKAVIRAQRAELKSDPTITFRRGASDWVSVRIAPGETDGALSLVAEAVAANRR